MDAGHTVLLIEHHLDVIKTADHVIDLGPDGGHAGGELVVTGTPEEVAACKSVAHGLVLEEASQADDQQVSAKAECSPDAWGIGPIGRIGRISRIPRHAGTAAGPRRGAIAVWQEVIAQIPGACVDAVVSGVGTGGTLVGLWEGFTDHGCDVTAFAARPIAGLGMDGAERCSFSGRIPGVADGLSAIYAAFQPARRVEIDVPDDEALHTARRLINSGFPVGPSSGLNYRAAQMAAERLGPSAHIVTVFPDRMERYFSTELFAVGDVSKG